MAFSGIRFDNPGNQCFANGSINTLLSSEQISSAVNSSPCFCCDFLHGMKNATRGGIHSSYPLKTWVASFNEDFDNCMQHDPSEFIQNLINRCNVLAEATKGEIITSLKCLECKTESNDANSDNRFRNILYEQITGDSVEKIIEKAQKNCNIIKKKLRCLSN